MNHVFFENIGMPRAPQPTEQEKLYLINSTVIEITNNWSFVKDMVNKYKNGQLSHVDQLEKEWLNFIIQNNIDIDQFENEDIFLKHHLKINV
jgi:hypothetical protein